jgi:hypothetical protein
VNNYFTLPKIFCDQHDRKTSACGRVRRKKKQVAPNCSPKNICGCLEIGGDPRAVSLKDKQGVYARYNTQIPSEADNVKAVGKSVKSLVIEDYTAHLDTLTGVTRWRTATALARQPGNGRKNCFRLLGLTVLNSYIV